MKNFVNAIVALRSIRKSLEMWSGTGFARVLLHENDARNIIETAWTAPKPNTIVILMPDEATGGVRVFEACYRNVAELKMDFPELQRVDDTFRFPMIRRGSTKVALTFETEPDDTGQQFSIGVL